MPVKMRLRGCWGGASGPTPRIYSECPRVDRADNGSPLKAEIERLSLLCDQHELKFRASKVCSIGLAEAEKPCL